MKLYRKQNRMGMYKKFSHLSHLKFFIRIEIRINLYKQNETNMKPLILDPPGIILNLIFPKDKNS